MKETMKRLWNKRPLRYTLGAAIGAAAGVAYWYFIGCQSGGCPITSSPYISAAYGGAVGVIAVLS